MRASLHGHPQVWAHRGGSEIPAEDDSRQPRTRPASDYRKPICRAVCEPPSARESSDPILGSLGLDPLQITENQFVELFASRRARVKAPIRFSAASDSTRFRLQKTNLSSCLRAAERA